MIQSNGITIDELGAMIARGFKKVDERFIEFGKEMNSGFVRVDKRIDDLELKVDNGFASVQNQLDSARLDYTPRREHTLLVDRVKKVERRVGIKF